MMHLTTHRSAWIAAITAEGLDLAVHLWSGRSLHYAVPAWLPGLVAAYAATGRGGRLVTVLVKRYGRYLCSTEAPAPEMDLAAPLAQMLEAARQGRAVLCLASDPRPTVGGV